MSNEIIKNGIIGSLESVVEMAANITSAEGAIHQLDVDLLMDQIRKLYREVQLLDEANRKEMSLGMASILLSQTKPAEKAVENIIPTIKDEPEEVAQIIMPQTEAFVPIPEPMAEAAPEPIPEPVIEPVHEPVHEPAPQPAPVVATAKDCDLFSQTMTIGDKLKKEDVSLHQQMLGNNQVRNEKLTGSPISNLRTAIGINDKFMFVNELFKGEMNVFDTVINTINAAPDEQSALACLHDNLQKFGTNEKAEARRKLEHFIQRRFAKS